jgi:hypothetical protein
LQPIPPDVVEVVLVEARRMSQERDWLYCEGIHLERNESGRLEGWSKLVIPSLPEDPEQDPDADLDLQTLLGILCHRSCDHDVSWRLTVAGEPIGAIERGVCNNLAWGKMTALTDMLQHVSEYEQDVRSSGEDGPDHPRFKLRIWPEPEG